MCWFLLAAPRFEVFVCTVSQLNRLSTSPNVVVAVKLAIAAAAACLDADLFLPPFVEEDDKEADALEECSPRKTM